MTEFISAAYGVPQPLWTRLHIKFGRALGLAYAMAFRPDVTWRRVRYLFIFSHMRSRSTLLAHMLGSHPQISGYLETHICYRSRIRFLQLRREVSAALGGAPLSRYVMDKVLHNWYIQPAVVRRMGILPIFLIRRPEESIRSWVRLLSDMPVERALSHATAEYLRRLRWMKRCIHALSRPGIFIESESLLSRTSEVLRLLEQQLELPSPLRESYEIFACTGQRFFGDFSPTILAGRIVREAPEAADPGPRMPGDLLAMAQEGYDRCVATLKRRCAHLQESAAERGEPAVAMPSQGGPGAGLSAARA